MDLVFHSIFLHISTKLSSFLCRRLFLLIFITVVSCGSGGRCLDHSWTNEELKKATGQSGCMQLVHPMKLQSAYASIKVPFCISNYSQNRNSLDRVSRGNQYAYFYKTLKAY